MRENNLQQYDLAFRTSLHSLLKHSVYLPSRLVPLFFPSPFPSLASSGSCSVRRPQSMICAAGSEGVNSIDTDTLSRAITDTAKVNYN